MPDQTMKATSLLNRAAVKRYALQCARGRAHKFTRVSQEFIDHIAALTEDRMHKMAMPVTGPDCSCTSEQFLTAFGKKRARVALNEFVKGTINAAVKRHPSVGVTLK